MFFGWTRYSAFYRGSKAFVAARAERDVQAYKQRLWAPERMRARAAIFHELSLPLLQQMSQGRDYRHLVTISADLPDPWMGQLREAAAQHPVLLLHDVEGLKLREQMREHLVATGSPSRTVVWFRVDDDDLLSITFLDQVAHYATRHDRGRGVSLGSGFSAVWHDGEISQVRAVTRRLGSQGQALVGRYDASTQTLHIGGPGSHSSLDRRLPTILDSRQPSFLQLRHLGQDTGSAADLAALRAAPVTGTAVESAEEFETLLELFPTLSRSLVAGDSPSQVVAGSR